MKRYFLIKYGFSSQDVLSIDHTELEKAIYAHLTGARAAFTGGSVSGDKIIAITPDYHRELGWPYDHVLSGHDYNDLDREGLRTKYTRFLGDVKEKVQYLITTHQAHLVGKNVRVPELERPTVELREGRMKQIGEILGR